MKTSLRTLDDLRGDSPCPMEWDALVGGDRVRNCSACGHDVLNLSALTRDEAERAVADPSVGCVRLLRRADGETVHADPPDIGFAGKLWAGLAAGVLMAVTAGCAPPIPNCKEQNWRGECVQWVGKK